jgi:hypothetical protein
MSIPLKTPKRRKHKMGGNLKIKPIHIAFITLIFLIPVLILGSPLQVKAQTEPTITVTGYTGKTTTYTLTQLENTPSINMNGGFYQPNQHVANSGLWTGVSLLYLCNQVGGITPTCYLSVTGQGTNNFTYDMITSGTNLNQQYITYNSTGSVQNQTQPITLILAYQVNGTNLPSGSQPAPRLVIVGPEGLLIDGSGGKSITQVTVTNTVPSNTPTPVPTPTSTAMPIASPTPSQIPSPTPSPTALLTASPTPLASASSQPIGPFISVFGLAIIGIILIVIIVIAVVLILTRQK